MVSVPDCLDRISAVLQLLGQLENVGPPPTSRQAINNLPKLTITQENVDAGCDCSVCMDSFNVDDDAKKLPCGHFFHIPCIEPWLELHNTCPICRKLVEDQSSSCDPEQAAPPPPPYQFTTSSSPPAESSSATQPSTSRAAGSSGGGGGGFFADLFLPFFGMPSRPRSGSGSDAPPRGGGDDHDDDHTYAS